MSRNVDRLLAALFLGLTVGFVLLAMNHQGFFEWVFARHHNILSWYIRPLMLLPFCYFAYQRSLAGVSATLFALMSSMFWFPAPDSPDIRVTEFLAMEMEYLLGEWTWVRAIFTAFIPLTFYLLAFALWKRSLKVGLLVLVFMAVSKIFWSLLEGGVSGNAILVPAIGGLVICVVALTAGFRYFKKNAAG